MLHVFDVDQTDVEKALGSILSKNGFFHLRVSPVDGANIGPQVEASSAPAYIIGPKLGRWVPVIDIHAEPWPSVICTELSLACSSHVLCIMVHDDDVMLYNLDRNGDSQDGYNSNPQYFENYRVPESEIQSQRHTPEPFSYLIPEGKNVEDLLTILNAGWWQAHDNGRLDDDGVMSDEDWDSCPYQDEGERMTTFCSYLELAGGSDYPFTYWRDNGTINWQDYMMHQFGKKS
jgi:hypothetical protein